MSKVMETQQRWAIGTMVLAFAVIANAVSIETVIVADPDNPVDAASGSLYGSVNYKYKIGKYEVTNNEYVEFLNAVAASDPYGLYDTNMFVHAHGGIERSGSDGAYTYAVKSGMENKPVNFVSFSKTVHFANWLTNGQGGPETTLDGAYDLSEPMTTVTRSNTRPGWFIASENEWYKAAYFDPTLNAGAGGYWTYATRSNTQPEKGAPPGTGNRANWDKSPNYPTVVGAYTGSVSYYGSSDQAGNLSEVTDTLNGAHRVRRGAHYYSNWGITSGVRTSSPIDEAARTVGFRVVMILRSGTLVRLQ